ncbi:MAG: RraA family protein [Acidobacteriota bacterium]
MRYTYLLFVGWGLVWAQEPAPFSRQFFEVKQYSQAENEAIVKKFHGLRVTDVADGLQEVGLQDVTIMDPKIGPMWTDGEKFTHRIYGVAVTLRLVPPQERGPSHFATQEEYRKWHSDWARRWIGRGMADQIKPDTILVIDASRTHDVGFCGSNNAYGWMSRGLRGIITDGGCRDSDEMVLQRIPVYQRDSTRGINQGRIAIESYNHPVNVGGVLVMPGDVIVADLDGVAVVPRAKAEAAAAAARRVQDGDKEGRRRLYEKMGRPADFTVK